MAEIFNEANPPNTEAAKLGAQRMRGIKAMLNNTLGLLYSVSVSDSEIATVTPVSSCISTTMLADSSVSTVKIEALAVNSSKIADGNITTAKLETSSSTTTGVTALKIAADAVTTVKILDANVTTAKIAEDAVTQDKIPPAHIASEHFLRPTKWLRYVTNSIGTGLTRATGVVTATLSNHHLRVGDIVVVQGDTSSPVFNGSFTVSTISATTITYLQAGANDASNGSTVLLYPASSYSPTGSWSTGATATRSGTTVTVGWTAHGLILGDRVRVYAASGLAFTGEFTITSVPSVDSFTYTTTTTGGISSTAVLVTKLARDITATCAEGDPDVYTLTFATPFPDEIVGATVSLAGAEVLAADSVLITGLSKNQAVIEVSSAGEETIGFSFHAFS